MYRWIIVSRRPRLKWCRPRRWMPRGESHFLVQLLDLGIGCGYVPRCGIYPIATYRGRGGLGPTVSQWCRPEYRVKRRSPSAVTGSGGPTHLAAVETNVLNSLPNIVAHCCLTRYDDGSTRRPGWLILRTMGASWVVQVKDPDGGCSMSLTAQTLDDALALADVMLGSDDAPWEADPYLKGQQPKKKN